MLLNAKSSSVDSIKEIHVIFTTPRDVTEWRRSGDSGIVYTDAVSNRNGFMT